jgi:hypothetical protein
MKLREIFIERCRDYQQHPPGVAWDGVCTMTRK